MTHWWLNTCGATYLYIQLINLTHYEHVMCIQNHPLQHQANIDVVIIVVDSMIIIILLTILIAIKENLSENKGKG